MPSSLVLIFFLTIRHKVRLLKLHGSVCMFAIFAFNLTVQFRRYMWNLVRIDFMASEEMSFENVDWWRRTDGWTTDACLYYKLTGIAIFYFNISKAFYNM